LVKKEDLIEDFCFLADRVLAVLIFGPSPGGRERRSLDICIVNPEDFNMRGIFQRVDVTGKNYDVWFFEELPLYIKMEIIESHEVLFCRTLLDLYGYFYQLRKLWKDQARRNKLSREELAEHC
jgi:hypothetical protein